MDVFEQTEYLLADYGYPRDHKQPSLKAHKKLSQGVEDRDTAEKLAIELFTLGWDVTTTISSKGYFVLEAKR